MKISAAIIVCVCLLAAACNNSQDRIIKHVGAPEPWLDYQVWGEEDKENVTVMLQFRTGDDLRKSILLEDPAGVKLDGKELKADSSKMTGIYYETESPAHAFRGEHSIVFTDFDGRKYTEKFLFQPFWLISEIPARVQRTGVTMEFGGLEEESYLRIIALDTVFKSRGINDVDTVKNGKLILSEKRLRNLANGPVHLELFREDEWRLKNGWKGGGRLSVSYGLKRDFELAD